MWGSSSRGAVFVSSDGHTFLGQAGIHSDALLPGLTAMTQAVHEPGGRIVAQLYHGGVLSNPEYTGQDALGPSVLNTGASLLGKADDDRTDPRRSLALSVKPRPEPRRPDLMASKSMLRTASC